ncbi:MAG: sulfate adenylyltransferase [Thermoplasmata archaeon]|nr:sulfate adenylyltransferase [Thermoplasmata archaeon]MCI4359427.1 sulfate adenylyltransferase [Thermoplasmata archaeon]
MIPRPHGGRLVSRLLSDPDRARREAELDDMMRLHPGVDAIYDAEKIGLGAYSPLEGFMNRTTLDSVLSTGRLPNELPWSIPILLAPAGRENDKVVASARAGDSIALLDASERPFAVLQLEEKFPYDRTAVARTTYGTTDPAHPNVADLQAAGEVALGGRIDLLRRLDLPTGPLELSPSESRAAFERRGWKNVAAYQCRNPPHTAHEYLQRLTLEREDVDALFIQPVVGRLKKGDYRPEIILQAYEALVRHYHPSDRVMLASLSITMRYAGPKAALFLAIVRKNFGCSHYIVGRDQAGVGTYYDPYAAHRIFDEYPIGIQPLRYEETFYCRSCGWMATKKTCPHPATDRLDTSQTRIRKALAEGIDPPTELLRPEVAKVLRQPNVLLES